MAHGGARCTIRLTPLAWRDISSDKSVFTADFWLKSVPPYARSSGSRVGTPAAATAAVRTADPAKSSQKQHRESTRRSASSAGGLSRDASELLEVARAPFGGAIGQTEGPHSPVPRAPHQSLPYLPALPALPLPCLPPPLPAPLGPPLGAPLFFLDASNQARALSCQYGDG